MTSAIHKPSPSRPPTVGPAACTIIARNYLSYATILAESYLRYEPGSRFYVLVVDGLPSGATLPEGTRLIAPGELDLAAFYEMCFKYDVTELCTAVKPALLSLLLTRYGEPSIVYFDPDILVLRPLEELKQAMAAADIVLIPHLLDPIPRDGFKPSEQDILIAGAHNLGFVALRASDPTARLLAWWGDRLRDGCRVDTARGLFVDQRWMDLAPSLFPSTALLRDETYDVAYWNLHSRMPERRGEEFEVGGRPLAFFHFSGFDPRDPQTLSRHQTRTNVRPGTALADLLERYAELHRRHGHAVCAQWDYGYSRFSNGVPVDVVFRRLFLGLDERSRSRFDNPFQVNGDGSFFEWARQPQRALGGLNPFLETLHALRTDLASAFPDPRGRNRAAFLEWARLYGAREMGFPLEIVPADEGGPPARQPRKAPEPGPAGETSLGVNVAGYLRTEAGLGAVARGYVAALRSAGVPVALRDFSQLSPNRPGDPTLEAFDSVHPHPVNLLCCNADQHFVVASHIGGDFLLNRRNIGVWFWELPEFPTEWHDRFAHYDEVWAPSSFIANALAAVSPVPVVRMPAVLTAAGTGDRERGRARLEADAGEFLWLFVFDFHSYFERKNPLALIEAFKQAFRPSDPVRLVIKCINSGFNGRAFASLQDAAREHRVSIHDGYWPLADMQDLLAACDGYASLHRSEGLGVPMANAMSLGKPVVCTHWSGNTDFTNVGNSFPVRYELVKLARNVGPYRAGGTWASPSVEHAAALLRQVWEGGAEVAQRAAAGRRTIESQYSIEAVGRALKLRLAVAAELRAAAVAARAGLAAEVAVSPPAPSEPATEAPSPEPSVVVAPRGDFTPSLPPLDLETSQHGLLGRWGKRAAALLLRYHTFHQQRVNAVLAAAVGDLAAQVAALGEGAGHSQAQARRDLETAHQAIARLEESARRLAARLETAEGAARAGQAEVMYALGRSTSSIEGRIAHLERGAALGERTAASLLSVQEQVATIRAATEAEMRQLSARGAALGEHAAASLRGVREEVATIRSALAALEAENRQTAAALRTAADGVAQRAEVTDGLMRGLAARAEHLEGKVAHIGYRFAARPYMGVDPFGARGDLTQPMGYGLAASPTAERPGFEDIFRGSEALVAERQRVYLPLLQGVTDVVDLGCGRGEFLGLLAEAGIRAVGVEKNAALVARGRARGLDVVEADALQYLRKRRPSSLGAVFSAQFIEHLLPEDILELLALARHRLREGGLFIAETPNPESFEALKTFHVDLTHQKPIYPQVLLQMCREQGYASARIFYPTGGGFTQARYESVGEYAVVATR